MRIRRKSPTKASVSDLQLVEFKGSLARKLRFHFFTSWNSKDASHESFVLTNQGCDLNVRIPLRRKKLARLRDGCGRRRFAFGSCSACARSGTDASRRLFLFFDDAVLLCFACVDTLCIGTAALKRCVHFSKSWNLKEASHESFAFTSSTLAI